MSVCFREREYSREKDGEAECMVLSDASMYVHLNVVCAGGCVCAGVCVCECNYR